MAHRSLRRSASHLSLWGLVAGAVVAAVATPAGASHIDGISITPLVVFPAFDETTHDYAMRCVAGDNVVDVLVDVPTATLISVDGSSVASGASTSVTVAEDQAVVVAVTADGATEEYWYRCLPSDFPAYTIDKPGAPTPGYYLVEFGLCFSTCPTTGGNFVMILDTNGVPVWYRRTRLAVIDQKLRSDGNLAFIEAGPIPRAYQINSFDGSLVDMRHAIGFPTDIHELLELADGNDAIMAYPLRTDVDLTSIGGGPNDVVVDGLIQEIDAAGDVVWEWKSQHHIGIEENLLPPATSDPGTDLVHLNSIDEFPDGDLLVSGRSVGVYRIDRSDGHVVWKLGGTPTPESLEIIGDPHDGPLFQHDARVLPDGTIFLFDNRRSTEVARAAQYAVDTDATPPTATLVWQYEHPDAAFSPFMGSARRQADGHTVVSWGGETPMLEEVDRLGKRVLVVDGPNQQQYRAVKYPLSTWDIDELRAMTGGSMETDAPSAVSATAGLGQATVAWAEPTAGQPITGSTVTARPGGQTCTTTGARRCTVTGLTVGRTYAFAVRATNRWGLSLSSLDSEAVTLPAVDLVTLRPSRIEDTRQDGVKVGSADGSGGPLRVRVLGRGGVPTADVRAVSLTVTVDGGELPDVGSGYVTVDGCAGPPPTASNLNFGDGQTIANSVITPVSASGDVCLYVYGTAHVIVDVNGYVPDGSEAIAPPFGGGPPSPAVPGSDVFPVAPSRLADTRQNSGAKVGSGDGSAGPLEVAVVGAGGVPATGVSAVLLTVTADAGELPDSGMGYVTVDGCATPRSTASNLNFDEGTTVADSVLVPVSADGAVCIYVYGTAHVLVDVNGYVLEGSDVVSLPPARVEDTRQVGAKVGSVDGSAGPLHVDVAGHGGVPPSGVSAVLLTVTVDAGELPNAGVGYVTVDGCATLRPTASNLNFGAGETIANSVIAPLSASGEICLYVYGSAHLLVDVNGYVLDGSAGSPGPSTIRTRPDRYLFDI